MKLVFNVDRAKEIVYNQHCISKKTVHGRPEDFLRTFKEEGCKIQPMLYNEIGWIDESRGDGINDMSRRTQRVQVSLDTGRSGMNRSIW